MQRTLLHTRTIDCQGYLREDGMFELEARLHDVTGADTPMPFGDREAGASIHDMRLALVIDRDLVIREVRATTATGATPYCGEADGAYASLAGLRIGPGFKQKVRERVGGVAGCTHLTELVNGAANVAMQTLFAVRRKEGQQVRLRHPEALLPRPWVIGNCHAYQEESKATQVLWPIGRRMPSTGDKR